MIRDEIVRIDKLAAFGGLTETDITLVLLNYCLEHGKEYMPTALFITTVLRDNHWQDFFILAMKWYERKFTIRKLYTSEGKLIMIY